MTSETNIFSFGESSDPMEKAKAALRAVRQYQQDWQDHGVDRVHKYFDDVEGGWLENFDEISISSSIEKASGVSLSDIFSQLKSLGFSTSFINKIVLPSWWKSELENDENSISQLLHSLAQRLLLEINLSQSSSDFSLDFLPFPAARFKLQKNQGHPRLFSYLARGIANAVLSTVERPYAPIPCDALAIRESILQNHSLVSLGSLLDFCWQSGIPVVHFDKKPDGHFKADGLVVMTDNRPAIVIGSSWKHSARLLFILAHELGHVAHGHLQEGILLDESFKDGLNDEEEDVANQFASQLLLGDIHLRWPSNLNQYRLLKRVKHLSKEQPLDPGVLVLNYGWQTGNWGCAVAALNQLEPSANAPAQINAYYQSQLVNIDEERRDYLERASILAA